MGSREALLRKHLSDKEEYNRVPRIYFELGGFPRGNPTLFLFSRGGPDTETTLLLRAASPTHPGTFPEAREGGTNHHSHKSPSLFTKHKHKKPNTACSERRNTPLLQPRPRPAPEQKAAMSYLSWEMNHAWEPLIPAGSQGSSLPRHTPSRARCSSLA